MEAELHSVSSTLNKTNTTYSHKKKRHQKSMFVYDPQLQDQEPDQLHVSPKTLGFISLVEFL